MTQAICFSCGNFKSCELTYLEDTDEDGGIIHVKAHICFDCLHLAEKDNKKLKKITGRDVPILSTL